MYATEQEVGAEPEPQPGEEPVFSDQFLAKMDSWLRSLDPLSEFVFRAALLRHRRDIRADHLFASRYRELKDRLTPDEVEQAALLRGIKQIEARIAALLPKDAAGGAPRRRNAAGGGAAAAGAN